MNNKDWMPTEGECFGIEIYGKIRNFAFVERCSNNNVKAVSVLGGANTYFTIKDEDRQRFMLSGTHWPKGSKAIPVRHMPEEMVTTLRELGNALLDKNAVETKRIFNEQSDFYYNALEIANDPDHAKATPLLGLIP